MYTPIRLCAHHLTTRLYPYVCVHIQIHIHIHVRALCSRLVEGVTRRRGCGEVREGAVGGYAMGHADLVLCGEGSECCVER